MRFIDSNILAYAFYENEFQENCRRVILGGGVIDALTLVEAFNIIEYQTTREIAVRVVRSFLKSNLEVVDVDLNLIFESLKRSQKHPKLKFLDLIHYTAALLKGCAAIVSYDKDFNNLEISRVEE